MYDAFDCMFLSCHVHVSEWIHTLNVKERLAQRRREIWWNLAKRLSVRSWTKWLWVRVQLQSLKLQISRLLRARNSWHSGNYRVWIHSETRTWHDKNIHYYSKLSSKLANTAASSKVYWSILKTFLNNKKIPCIPPLFHKNKFITNFKEKAELFNTLFCKPMYYIEQQQCLAQ